jgi:primosomal protein N' (replication factor Y) (superfamily II helicase)
MVSPPFDEKIRTGSMVILSSCKGKGTFSVGYVIDTAPGYTTEASGLELSDVLHDGFPVLTSSLIMLSAWMADYYFARRIETIEALIPAAVRTTIHDIVELTAFELNADKQKIINTALRRSIMQLMVREKRLTVMQLQRKLGKKQLYQTLSELERGGYLVMKKKFSLTKPKLKIAYRLSTPLPENIETSLSAAPKQLEALLTLSGMEERCCFYEKTGCSRDILNALVKKGLLEKVPVEVKSNFSTGFTEKAAAPKKPTAAQSQLLEQLRAAVEKNEYKTFLLHGVTGSGKTLVYIELLKTVLASGKTAIVLVPEIALTPQTAARFREHFHDDITIMHSGMNNQEKYDAWHALRYGKTKIALGARSTVFAPLENIGAIIVDEEHDSAYKQDRHPRYHARDTAVMRAMFSKAICVLGSATPSFESYNNTINSKYTLLSLTERIDGAKMPVIRMISMKDAPKASASISDLLYRQIALRLEHKEQVILLQNRRGFSGSIFCLSCGHIPVCSFCNIPLVYHASKKHLRCHYCGHTIAYKASCSRCSSPDIYFKGSGTERIEEELSTLFPGEKVLRMDVDTTSKKGAHGRILREFQEGTASILLGTQMVSKGLDFPSVTMVGVLLADIGLNIPDFRASERIFSLLTQVAGRAGRSSKPGEVFLQVYNTENDVFPAILHGSYEEFFHRESAIRRHLNYPPATRLIKFECSSPDEKAAESAAGFCAETLVHHLLPGKASILGPAPAGIAKLRGRFRYHVLMKLAEGKLSPLFIREMSDSISARYRKQDLLFSIDVDPLNLM